MEEKREEEGVPRGEEKEKEEKALQKEQGEELPDLDQAFEELNNETPLNLTDEGEKGEDDPEMAKQIQENYEKFMNEMKNMQFEGEDNMDDLSGSIAGLLKGLTETLGVEGVQLVLFRRRASS
jgi:hypothetical protein